MSGGGEAALASVVVWKRQCRRPRGFWRAIPLVLASVDGEAVRREGRSRLALGLVLQRRLQQWW